MKKHIADCIEEMLKNKPIEDISIKDVLASAEISKSTFYRYFLDKYDALNWIYVQELKKNQEKYTCIFEQSFHNMIFLQQRKDFQKSMIFSAQNSLHNHITEFSLEQLMELAAAYYMPSPIPPEIEASVFIYAIGSVELSMHWLKEGAKMDVSTFIEAQKNAASPLLLDIFSIDASAAAVAQRAAKQPE